MNQIAPVNSPEAKDIASVLHPHTNHIKHRETGPFIIERGDGVFVYDTEGKRYLEGMSGMWSAGLGFSEKRLARWPRNSSTPCPSTIHSFIARPCRPLIWPRN